MMKEKKILVAMSGGVDSSVTAAILKSKGFSVSGAFMNLASVNEKQEEEAFKVADFLNIPFYSFDFTKEFNESIVNNFIEKLKIGETPNPCVDCNEKIKLNLFLEKAFSLGFDSIATGHYSIIAKRKNQKFLYRGKDKLKDQSYFLWKINQKSLNNILLPLGKIKKKKVKKISEKMKLPLSSKKESMDICFIENSLNDFLSKNLKDSPGLIFNDKKEKIGDHLGLWNYTVGQRKGINLSGGPYFVSGKDIENNILFVSKEKPTSRKLKITNINWISNEIKRFPFKAEVQIRYGHKASKARIDLKDKFLMIEFYQEQESITPGQSAVIYKKNKVIGGGIISLI
jgi:tRNA-uridine 2-sulfurtransferase